MYLQTLKRDLLREMGEGTNPLDRVDFWFQLKELCHETQQLLRSYGLAGPKKALPPGVRRGRDFSAKMRCTRHRKPNYRRPGPRHAPDGEVYNGIPKSRFLALPLD